ncbi:cyclophilin-like fold protein [Pediococcus parvulus]|uniref:cyclophilin-like fold protein n=1 Tax=Pediococcus parvulus TaxID=54062 RepID=UPI0021A5D8A6|nr:cyclophilin-like fold protein [Pediococcus parvulus]MCT3034246.1 hypothetical protein [Pediococcus parvulus]
MKITFNESAYPLEPEKNHTAAAIQKKFPQTLTLQRRRDIEYYAKLAFQPVTVGVTTTAQIHAGGLYYYEDWNVLSFQLQDADITPFKMIYLGELESTFVRLLRDAQSELTVKLSND